MSLQFIYPLFEKVKKFGFEFLDLISLLEGKLSITSNKGYELYISTKFNVNNTVYTATILNIDTLETFDFQQIETLN